MGRELFIQSFNNLHWFLPCARHQEQPYVKEAGVKPLLTPSLSTTNTCKCCKQGQVQGALFTLTPAPTLDAQEPSHPLTAGTPFYREPAMCHRLTECHSPLVSGDVLVPILQMREQSLQSLGNFTRVSWCAGLTPDQPTVL